MIILYLMVSILFLIISFLVAVWQDYLAFDYRKFCPEFFVANQDYFYVVLIVLFFVSVFIVLFSVEVNKYLFLVNILEYFLKKYLSRIYSVNKMAKEVVKNGYKNTNNHFNKESIEAIKKYLREERKNLV